MILFEGSTVLQKTSSQQPVLGSRNLSLCCCTYFVMNLNISAKPTERKSCGKQQNLTHYLRAQHFTDDLFPPLLEKVILRRLKNPMASITILDSVTLPQLLFASACSKCYATGAKSSGKEINLKQNAIPQEACYCKTE